jgi:hypothetical protein
VAHQRLAILNSKTRIGVESMADLFYLVAASIGALAFGILAAYGILRVGFWLMRPAQQLVAKPRPEVARVL